MTNKPGRRRCLASRPAPWRGRGNDNGFALVEVIAATTILMIIVVSLSNLLVDSLTASLLARQREAAASIASDTVENAKALGTLTSGSASCPSSAPATNYTPLSALTAAELIVPYSTTVDRTVYTVCTSVIGTASPYTIAVTIQHNASVLYTTTSQVTT